MDVNAEQQQKTDADMARARNLKGQIMALQQQYASNPDANQGAPATIDNLQRELNSIPNSASW